MAGSFAYKRQGLCFSPVHQESITYDHHKCEWVSQVSPSLFGVILLCSKIFYSALDAGSPPTPPPPAPAGWAGGVVAVPGSFLCLHCGNDVEG